MDYVVGSVAALVSGNVTPNRPRILKRALTPTKHQPSPNVTPKSEFVDDRSIFLSPTLQKKKAIVKKSPKRIFQNPDLDVTSEGDGNIEKADKVKKHLKEELDDNEMVIKSPAKQKNASAVNKETLQCKSPKKNAKTIKAEEIVVENTQTANESTPKKKKKQRNSICNTPETEKEINQEENVVDTDNKINIETEGTPKMKKKGKKLKLEAVEQENKENVTKVSTKIESVVTGNPHTSPKKKKKNRKRKNKNAASSQSVNVTEDTEKSPDEQDEPQISKKKRKLSETVYQEPNFIKIGQNTMKSQNNEPKSKKKNKQKKKSKLSQKIETDIEIENKNEELTNPSKTKKNKSNKNIVNPNAITNKDTDSEHESDDEINSETEEANNEIFNNGSVEESSDEEDEGENETSTVKKKEGTKKVERTEINIQEELKRTLFVGNVTYTPKCKKDLKKIFMHYGAIESIRFRAIPIKDARLTPKVAVIKNELHPERSTVNVYIKYKDAESVDKALVENNTLFKDKHLRVTRSESTGDTHDPKASVFVGNLPFALEDEALREKFENCGEIESVRIVRDKKTNIGKGFGYVNFKSKDGVELALSLTDEDLTIKNRILRVKRCTYTNKLDKPLNQSINSQRDFNNRRDFNNGGDFNSRRSDSNSRGGSFNSRGGNFNSRGRGFNNRGGRGLNRGGQRSFNDRGNGDFHSRGGTRGRGFQRGGRGGSSFSSRGGQRSFSSRNEDGQTQGYQQGRSDKNDIGAFRRIQNKREYQGGSNDGPPNKRPKNINQPGKEKKPRKEFVGMTAEKKKKRKTGKSQGLRQKKALSEILTK